MAYMDTGFKNLLPSTTDWQSKWIDTSKKQTYPNGWPKERPPWSKKTPQKGTALNNCRLITCLSILWKIQTAQVRVEIYNSLMSRGPYLKEQKGCRKWTRATGELLINTSSRRARQDGKTLLWPGLTTKKHMIWSCKLSQNVQDIRQSNKVYRKYSGRLETRTDRRRKRLNRRKNLERNLPERCAITITVC